MFLRSASLCAAVLMLSGSTWAGPYDRASDTRTVVPELLLKERDCWGLDAALGGYFNDGNVDRAGMQADATTFKKWDRAMAYIAGSYLVAGVGETFKRNQNQGSATLRYDYQLGGGGKLFAFNTHGFNEFQGIKYRGTAGLGPWQQWELGPLKNGASIAITHEFENFSRFPSERTVRLSFRDVLEVKISKTARVGADTFYVPSLSGWSDFRLSTAPYLESQVWGETVGLKISLLFERDNGAKPGVDKNDTQILTSMTLRLGN